MTGSAFLYLSVNKTLMAVPSKSPTLSPTILVIDDDSEIRYSLERVFSSRNYRLLTAASGEEGVEAVRSESPDVIFLDIRMAGMSGLETLQHIKSIDARPMVILMTAYGTTQTAIEAMKFGAFDYLMKPFDMKKVIGLTEGALKASSDLRNVRDYRPVINSDDYQEGIVGHSEAMQSVFKMIGQVASSDVTILITGESGTGKELVSRCIVQHSQRHNKPFVAVNCAALPENLIESELFGHEKGAFTGATSQRPGKFELCDGGTIFLDEIGDMSPQTQTKVLRVIQEGELQRVGGTKTFKTDVRLIAATNRDLESMVKEKTFREDLYYRLNVVRIRLPSLRERKEDIPELVEYCLQKLQKRRQSAVSKVSAEAAAVLNAYDWPGNVRELENVIYRSAVMAQGDAILLKDLPEEIPAASGRASPAPEPKPATENAVAGNDAPVAEPAASPHTESAPESQAFVPPPVVPRTMQDVFDELYARMREESTDSVLDTMEREMILRALRETGGNQVRASGILGITRATLRKRIDQFSLKDKY